MSQDLLIYIVDDDPEQTEVTAKLLASQGYKTQSYPSGEQFLAQENYDDSACLLLDNRMPGISGLDVQEELMRRGNDMPIIFMSGDSTFKHVVKALKSGAYEFLQKPISSRDLFESVSAAIDAKKTTSSQEQKNEERDERLKILTTRETQVLELLSRGFTNKMISKELSIVVSTVEFHRANLMNKLNASSLADIIAIYRGN